MTEIELAPCPFCGGEAEIERYGNSRQSTIYQCTNCGCNLETGEEWGHGTQWNTRPEAADKLEALSRENAAMREALQNIAEGNLGDQPWEANYDRIREVARAALAQTQSEG